MVMMVEQVVVDLVDLTLLVLVEVVLVEQELPCHGLNLVVVILPMVEQDNHSQHLLIHLLSQVLMHLP
tara:strand:+ start:52 stop:255 length:204 start_codon:yes stop_codon:yes gene_type:complete